MAAGADDAAGGGSDTSPDAGSVPRRVWSATALRLGGRLVSSACTFAILAVLARHLSGVEFGRFTFYLAAFALLDGLVEFGTGQVAVQRSARDPWATAPALASARRIRATAGVLGALAVSAGAFAFGEPGAPWIALAALYPITHALGASAVVFERDLEWRVPVVARAASAVARLALTLGLVALDEGGAAAFLLASAAGSTLGNVWIHLAARPRLPRPTIAVRAARGLLADAWPLGLAGVCQQAYFYVDNAFVRALEGDLALGRYNAGVRLLSLAIVVAQFAPSSGLPWLAKRDAEGGLGAAAARLGQPLFAAAGLACGLLLPFSAPLLELVYGEGYAEGAAAFGWLLGAVVLIHAGAPLLTAVVAAGRTRAVLAVTSGALALNVVGNALLVPRLGIEGAAIATVATEGAVALGAAWALRGSGLRVARPALWLLGPLGFAAGAALSGLVA